jgi:hypothetical protein
MGHVATGLLIAGSQSFWALNLSRSIHQADRCDLLELYWCQRGLLHSSSQICSLEQSALIEHSALITALFTEQMQMSIVADQQFSLNASRDLEENTDSAICLLRTNAISLLLIDVHGVSFLACDREVPPSLLEPPDSKSDA